MFRLHHLDVAQMIDLRDEVSKQARLNTSS
jgi:hypothetical protein